MLVVAVIGHLFIHLSFSLVLSVINYLFLPHKTQFCPLGPVN